MSLTKCVRCGTDQEPGERFCGECGKLFPTQSSTPLPPTAPGAPICPRCGARVTTRFCGECGTPIESAPRSDAKSIYPAQPVPAGRPSAPSGQPRKSILRALIGILLAFSLLVGVASIAARLVILYQTNPRLSGPANYLSITTTFTVISCFLFGWSLAVLFPRLSLLYLLPSLAWVALGLLALSEVLGTWLSGILKSDGGFWPDWIFATGLANLIGIIFGLVIAIIVRISRRTA